MTEADVRAALEQLYADLGARIDAGDAGVAELFVGDGRYVSTTMEVSGADRIGAMVAGMSGATTRHAAVGLMIAGTGNERATRATGHVAVLRDGATSMVVADYAGTVRFVDGHWRLVEHRVTPVMRLAGQPI
jgi:hypothetical protein